MITKKEHYIPRAAVLRNFSDTHGSNDRQNKLVAYDAKTNWTYCTNVYDSACENYLYEYDSFEKNAVEHFFAEIDSDCEKMLSDIVSICMNPLNNKALILSQPNERENLKFFLMLQLFRTQKARDSSGTQESFLYHLIGKGKTEKWVVSEYIESLSSHFFVFNRNESNTPFVLPDHPVSRFHSFEEENAVNYRFPLSPHLQILLIDPNGSEADKMKPFRNRIMIIPEGYDDEVAFWNRKSVEECNKVTFFTPGTVLCLDPGSKDYMLCPPNVLF